MSEENNEMGTLLDFNAKLKEKRLKEEASQKEKLQEKINSQINPDMSENEKVLTEIRVKNTNAIKNIQKELSKNPDIFEEAAWRITNIYRSHHDQLTLEEWREKTKAS